jgi:O-antigen/teichoic acid export membrane protein
LQVLPNVTRLLAGFAFAYAGFSSSVETWALLYLSGTAAATVIGVTLVWRELGPPLWRLRGMLGDLKVGYHFSVSLSAQSVYNDIDKTMLARMSTTAAVGTYAAAYRIIDVAFVPVRAMLFSTYSQFFRNGAAGLRATAAYARRLLPTACGYSIGAGALILLMAPIVPLILGEQFVDTVETLRWLAVLPLLKSLHYLAADSLTGAGLQPIRSRVQVLIALTNIGVNVLLIPRYSWRGAAWASLVCDALLAAALWLVVMKLVRAESSQDTTAAQALTYHKA